MSALFLLLLAACETEEPAAIEPEPTEEVADVVDEETTPDTEPPDTGAPSEPVVCEADKDAPTSTRFYCLSGMTCIGCDSLLELVLEIEVACVLDAELLYGEVPGIALLHYTDEVDFAHAEAIIEDTEGSLYTITCAEDQK